MTFLPLNSLLAMAPITDVLPSFGEVETPVANSTVAIGRLAWSTGQKRYCEGK